jgi:flagellar biosynthesis protein FlhA
MGALFRREELALGGALLWILALLIVPLPAFLVDLLVAFSFTLAVLILLLALYAERPLDFSVFPSLLLIVTLMRLGLNVASTRLILSEGANGTDAAGRVIQAFANVTIGGNPVVGVILFIIFVTINFIVIAKGSGRIAEVAARFTLDAMPGKQMAIDADLNQGLLDEAEARRRRKELQREADFYGAMDGASKFVRGDAIAGLVIVAVNIIGGFAIGVLQDGLSLGQALETFTSLTIGEGLVGQIPALVVSTAAGLVVSRAAGGDPLGRELGDQVIFQPRGLAGAATLLGALALAPGFPFGPFALLGAGAGALAWWSAKRPKPIPPPPPAPAASEVAEADARRALALDELELELGYGLVPLVDPKRGDLPARIRAARKQLASELGFVVPLIHIRDQLELDPSEYAVLVRGNRVASSRVPPGRVLAVASGANPEPLPGIATRDAAYGLPAVWIQEADRALAEARGYTVVDAAAAVTTHLTEVVRAHAADLLTRRQVRELLDSFSERAPKVLEEIVPSVVPVATLHRTLRALLGEGVPIRDLGLILETLAEHAAKIQQPELLTDLVRERLARTVARPHIRADGQMHVLMLEQSLEQALQGAVQHTPSGSFLAVEPSLLDRLVRAVQSAFASAASARDGRVPVLLSGQAIRAPLRQLLARVLPRIAVLSHNELPSDVRIVLAGEVRLADAH